MSDEGNQGSRSSGAPQRRSALGGGSPTGLSAAMFGGSAARMPGYKPAGRAAEPQSYVAPKPAASPRDSDPFDLGGSDPYGSDPFGLAQGNLDDSLTLDDDFSKFEAAYAPSEPARRSYQDSAYENAEDDGEDASFGYGDQTSSDQAAHGDGGYAAGSEYKASAFDYYSNEPAQSGADYKDDALALESEPEEEQGDDDYLALGGEQQDAGFDEADYRHPRDVYAASADLDEQPFDLAGSDDDSSYNDGYGQTSDDEIDAYIARAQREAEQAPPRQQASANVNAQGQSRLRPSRGTAVQAFDAPYDQKRPEIPLTGFSASRTKGPQRRQAEQAQHPEEFEGDIAQGWKSKFQLKRVMVMVASAAACVVVLGGALAFAYRSGNADVASGETPIVEADSRPVKVAPENGGSPQAAGGNKLIYDRLGSDNEQAAAEQVIPRQEEVDLSSLNGLNGQAQPANADGAQPAAEGNGSLGGVAQPALPGVTEGVPPMPGAESEPAPQQAADPNSPRRVATYVVRPDGTVVQPEEPAPAAPAAAAPENVAAIPQGEPAPAQAAVAGGGDQFVVQVGARKSQEEALAAFADLQQRYPQLLSGYRPMVQKADLGDKGTWFRLRVGPMPQKTAAAKLCDDLKGAGLPSCLVMTE